MKSSSGFHFFVTIIISAVTVSRTLVSASIADNNVYVIEKDSICETPACIQEASFILGNMNSSADPCENFYVFACGKFVQETIIPDNQNEVSTFSITNDKTDQRIRLRLADEIKKNDQPWIKSLKSYYQTCTDTDQLEKNSENDLQEVLRQLGGCPALEGPSWDEEHFDWKQSVYEANKIGYDSDFFVEVHGGYSPQDSSRYIITIDQASTSFPRDFSIIDENNDKIRAYSEFSVKFLELFGIDKIQAEKEVNGVIDFSTELQKISLLKEQPVPMTVHQLESKYVGIPWKEYLNEILTPHGHLDQNVEVIVVNPNFLERLPGLITNTSNRVLANHICFQTTLQSIDYMGTRISNVKTEVLKAFSDTKKQLPRWQICLQLAIGHFRIAIAGLYVRNYFVKNSKSDAVHLTRNLRNSLNHLIEQANWMDITTKLARIEKLQSLVARVGHPDELDSDENLNELYGNITLYPRSFLKFEMSVHRHQIIMQNLLIRKSIDKLEWMSHSQVTSVNPFYDLYTNSFDLPAGILQGHFYNIDRPKYLNYGAIGSVIGHELSHALDTVGSQYDKNGKFVNWWKNETRIEYLDRVRCLIEQYSNYTVKGINLMINGIQSQRENIADNVGLKVARYAYNKWTNKHAANCIGGLLP